MDVLQKQFYLNSWYSHWLGICKSAASFSSSKVPRRLELLQSYRFTTLFEAFSWFGLKNLIIFGWQEDNPLILVKSGFE